MNLTEIAGIAIYGFDFIGATCLFLAKWTNRVEWNWTYKMLCDLKRKRQRFTLNSTSNNSNNYTEAIYGRDVKANENCKRKASETNKLGNNLLAFYRCAKKLHSIHFLLRLCGEQAFLSVSNACFPFVFLPLKKDVFCASRPICFDVVVAVVIAQIAFRSALIGLRLEIVYIKL